MNVVVPAHPPHPPSHFPFLAISHILAVLQHLLHAAPACTPFINLHLHNHTDVSRHAGELTLTCEPAVPSVNLHTWKKKKRSRKSVFSSPPWFTGRSHTHQAECWTDLWVSRNIWGKHLSQSSNWIVPRCWCYNSVMSLVSCANLTISHKLLSTWREFFSLLCALVHHQF